MSTGRSTFVFDLSGIKYVSRGDISALALQWNTFEQIESTNSVILQDLAKVLPSGLMQKDISVFRRPANYEEASDYKLGQLAHIKRYPDISDFMVPYANRPVPYSPSTLMVIQSLPVVPDIVTSMSTINVAFIEPTVNKKAQNIYNDYSTFTAKYPKSVYKFNSSGDFLLYKTYRDVIGPG